MLYDIRMTISYSYPNAAGFSRQLLRVLPRNQPGQQDVSTSSLTVLPDPIERTDSVDFFGNPQVEVTLEGPHEESIIRVAARVRRLGASRLLDVAPRLEDLPRDLAGDTSLGPEAPHHFLGDTPFVPRHPEITRYAAEAAAGRPTVYEIVRGLGERIQAEFAYDADATEVDTPALTAFRARHGVCQDFSHVMIAGLRGLGIPAGYVSGFLRTEPPEGQPRLEGADAMHAWVRAWCGHQMGWVEYDPTNALQVARDHVVIAYGRDYSDVSPVKGVMRMTGEQETRQSVDVIVVD
jgi:transglutaminase-like putative cysteine protease